MCPGVCQSCLQHGMHFTSVWCCRGRGSGNMLESSQKLGTHGNYQGHMPFVWAHSTSASVCNSRPVLAWLHSTHMWVNLCGQHHWPEHRPCSGRMCGQQLQASGCCSATVVASSHVRACQSIRVLLFCLALVRPFVAVPHLTPYASGVLACSHGGEFGR